MKLTLTHDINDFEACAKMMLLTDPWIKLGFSFQNCRNAFNGEERETYILKENDTIIGFVIIQPKGSFRGYIQTLCVNETHRGKGIGKQILQMAEKMIHAYSPNVFICVSDFNKEALKLYKNEGFIEVGHLPDFIKEGFTEILLRKSIGPILPYQTN